MDISFFKDFLNSRISFLVLLFTLDSFFPRNLIFSFPQKLTKAFFLYLEKLFFRYSYRGRLAGFWFSIFSIIYVLGIYYIVYFYLSSVFWFLGWLWSLFVSWNFFSSFRTEKKVLIFLWSQTGQKRKSAKEKNKKIIEKISMEFVKNFIAPVFYFSIFGVSGILIFYVINQLDQNIGYKTARFKKFGSFVAFVDDLLRFIPVRLAWLLLMLLVLFKKPYSAPRAFKVSLKQARNFSGVNKGLVEGVFAGGLKLRLFGPYFRGATKFDLPYLGEPKDRIGSNLSKVRFALLLVQIARITFLLLSIIFLFFFR